MTVSTAVCRSAIDEVGYLTRKRGKAQRDVVALRCFTPRFTDTELLWRHAKISLPWQQRSVGVQFVGCHYIARPLKPPLWHKNLALVSYTSRVIANFMSK